MQENTSEETASLKVLAVHSYAIHGTASIKAATSILGSYILPVPSLVLTGLTNIPNILKFNINFQEIWFNTLRLVRERNFKIILYIGYLGDPDQVTWILEGIRQNRDLIKGIVVDPVSGDHGRVYVPKSIVNVWPSLISEANWVLPNFTEIKLYSGLKVDPNTHTAHYIDEFKRRFPSVNVIITSIYQHDQVQIQLIYNGRNEEITHERIPIDFGGTGDTFASQFILAYYFKNFSAIQSVQKAAEFTLACMKRSIQLCSDELLILPA